MHEADRQKGARSTSPPTEAELAWQQKRRQDHVQNLEAHRAEANQRKAQLAAREHEATNDRRPNQGFVNGDLVLRELHNRPNKLAPFWEGPFIIYDVTAAGSYQLQALDGFIQRSLCSHSQLKLAHGPINQNRW